MFRNTLAFYHWCRLFCFGKQYAYTNHAWKWVHISVVLGEQLVNSISKARFLSIHPVYLFWIWRNKHLFVFRLFCHLILVLYFYTNCTMLEVSDYDCHVSFWFLWYQDGTKVMDLVDTKRVRVGRIHVLNRLGVVLRGFPNTLILTNQSLMVILYKTVQHEQQTKLTNLYWDKRTEYTFKISWINPT